MLNIPVNNFSVMLGRSHRFLGITSTFRGVNVFAQGHNIAEVGIEPLTSPSGVRDSTTRPKRSRSGNRVSIQNKIYMTDVNIFKRKKNTKMNRYIRKLREVTIWQREALNCILKNISYRNGPKFSDR